MSLLVSIDDYKTLFEHTTEAFFLADPVGNEIFHANKAACGMFGYTREEIVQLGRDALVDTTGPHFNMLLHDRFEKKGFRGVVTGIRRNGERFPLEVTTVMVEDKDGKLIASTLASDMSKHETVNAASLKSARLIHQQEEESRALLESVLNSLSDGFFIMNRNFTILFWNNSAEKLLGRSADDVVGKNLWEEYPELAGLKQYDDFQKLYKENKSIRFREYFAPFQIWADVSVYPSEKYFSVYIKDMTEVKNLRALEKLERDVLEMNARPDVSLEQTLDFYLRSIENIHPDMICSVLRVKNGRVYNWSSPSLPDGFRIMIEGAEIGPEAGSCGTAAYTKEKIVVSDITTDHRWVDYQEAAVGFGLRACWSFPLLDAGGEVMGTFAVYYRHPKTPTQEEEYTLERSKNILTIMLENRLSVEAVKLSNQSYDMVALATNDAIWDWDISTNMVQRRGKGLKILFGYDLEESRHEENFWYKRIHPDDLDSVFFKQRGILDDPKEIYWEDEYRFLKKNGQYAYVHDKGYIIRNSEGRAVRLLGATRDITERKENEALLLELNNRLKQRADELAASNIELERFAYIASHDMQEPLRMITSFLQLFKKKYEDQIDETAEQYIHFAVDGADRMKKLIMDLLQYSRVGSNKEDVEPINTNQLLTEVAGVFQAAAAEADANIVVDVLPDVKANRTQLFQLFQNLIGNALKYRGDQPPRIYVTGSEEERHYQFSVRDNGIGIKPIFFEKIFVLFQRLHHKNEYSGTGIGLAICKKIVERHHGRIWVESEPGKGSCFHFTIAKDIDL